MNYKRITGSLSAHHVAINLEHGTGMYVCVTSRLTYEMRLGNTDIRYIPGTIMRVYLNFGPSAMLAYILQIQRALLEFLCSKNNPSCSP